MLNACKHKSIMKALLSAAVMLLIVMTTIVQHHHHCSCHHHSSPSHEHQCALHIDAADQLRHDFDFNDYHLLHIDAATITSQVEVASYIAYSQHISYKHQPLTHYIQPCADVTRRGPPSGVDQLS